MRILSEVGLVFRRQLTLSLRSPAWVVVGLLQPVLYLALFGPLLQPLTGLPQFPRGDAWQVFVPGLLVMQAIFGAVYVGFGLLADWRSGVLERLRVTPMRRFSLLMGRVLHDAVVLVVQSVVLVLVALALGFRAPVPAVLIGLGFMLLVGIALAALSYMIALKVKNEGALAPALNTIGMPVFLLSGILLPLSMAPSWLNAVAYVNPLRYVVEGMREAMLGDYTAVAVGVGLAVAVATAAVALLGGIRAFNAENA
ncbi:ABC transporter permease [Nonomuraea typhae]|uniref:Transport permease protein n=1 Tax=Nonomuraea typhae TaxID=2603600 RepID=A0ABW7YTQ2_9ACTN